MSDQPATTRLKSLWVIYLALVMGVATFAVILAVLVVTGDPVDDPPITLALVAFVFGAIVVVAGPKVAPKLDGSSEAALFRTYQSRLIIRMALTEGPVLFMFVTFLLTHAWWTMLVGVVFAVVGFFPAAPTRSSIERDQETLSEQGSAVSLLGVLSQAPQA